MGATDVDNKTLSPMVIFAKSWGSSTAVNVYPNDKISDLKKQIKKKMGDYSERDPKTIRLLSLLTRGYMEDDKAIDVLTKNGVGWQGSIFWAWPLVNPDVSETQPGRRRLTNQRLLDRFIR